MLYVFLDFLTMHALSYLFYRILNKYNIEKIFLGNLSFNLTRSVICGCLTYYSYKNLNNIYFDKCLTNEIFSNNLKSYHRNFLNYFIYDIFVMIYQVYKNINKNIRMDLLFHHLLGIFVLHLLENNKMYNLSLLIGLSEGMSIVSGLKLITNELNQQKFKNILIYFRLGYLVLVRMLYLWPSLFLFYIDITNNCDNFKEYKNTFMVLNLIAIIVYNETNWINSGLKELKRL